MQQCDNRIIAMDMSTIPIHQHRFLVVAKLRSQEFPHKVSPRVISSGQGASLEIAGKSYLNFCSSHYLGFAEEPRLKAAAKNAIDK